MNARLRNDTLYSVTIVSQGQRRTIRPDMEIWIRLGSYVEIYNRDLLVRSPDGRIIHSPLTLNRPGLYTILGQSIIDRILSMECLYMNNQPYVQSPCEYQKYQDIVRRIDPSVINDITEAMVPGQGWKPITMLEAALLMRNVPLVSYLLANGADPRITSTGVPLTQQLYTPYQDEASRELMHLLLREGAPPVVSQW